MRAERRFLIDLRKGSVMTRSHVPNAIDYVEFPVSGADALAQTESFFSQVFGWGYKNWGDSYADTTDSGVGSGLTVASAASPLQPLVVIYSDDLAATRTKILDAGGTITCDTFPFPGGRRFHFKEPSGVELAVWSDR